MTTRHGVRAIEDPALVAEAARLLEKMNMKTNAELTYYAIKNRLIE